jgi:hypothetical protein
MVWTLTQNFGGYILIYACTFFYMLIHPVQLAHLLRPKDTLGQAQAILFFQALLNAYSFCHPSHSSLPHQRHPRFHPQCHPPPLPRAARALWALLAMRSTVWVVLCGLPSTVCNDALELVFEGC